MAADDDRPSPSQRSSTSEEAGVVLAAAVRIRALLRRVDAIPKRLAEELLADLAVIERAADRLTGDSGDDLPMHAHRPERMLRGQ